MTKEIRHRRLYAFYNSKVLNVLWIIGVVSLMQIGWTPTMLMPVICSTTAFSLFIGYSLWLWIKKPNQIVINQWLSNQTNWFTLYFLLLSLLETSSPWLYILPLVAAIILAFITTLRSSDHLFNIDEKI